MNGQMIQIAFNGSPVQFNHDGWFNATLAAERFGVHLMDWLHLPENEKYIQTLEANYGKIPYVTSSACEETGRDIWFHPRLAVRFGEWLSMDFSIWLHEQIEEIIRGDAWHIALAGMIEQHKALCMMVDMTCKAAGKQTSPHHYIDEIKLVNLAVTGSVAPVDYRNLSKSEVRLLKWVERLNTVLIGMGKTYEQRQSELPAFAAAKRQRSVLPVRDGRTSSRPAKQPEIPISPNQNP